MNKLETFLDQIYNNANKSLYFYIIIGGIALILVLVLILASIKPKNIEEIDEDIKEKTKPSIKSEPNEKNNIVSSNEKIEDTLIMKPIIDEEIKIDDKTIFDNEIPKENTEEKSDFSSVYLDIKPTNEKFETKPEIKLELVNNDNEISKENLSVNPNIFENETNKFEDKEEITIPIIEKPIVETLKENDSFNINEDIPTNIFKEEINVPKIDKEELHQTEDMPMNITKEEINAPITDKEEFPIIEDELPMIKPDFIKEEIIPIEEEVEPELLQEESIEIELPKKEEIIPIEEIIETTKEDSIKPDLNVEEKSIIEKEPVVLSIDDIKSKLEKLSNINQSNGNENAKNTLDELLKQIGVEESPEISNIKDEESILLGK